MDPNKAFDEFLAQEDREAFERGMNKLFTSLRDGDYDAALIVLPESSRASHHSNAELNRLSLASRGAVLFLTVPQRKRDTSFSKGWIAEW